MDAFRLTQLNYLLRSGSLEQHQTALDELAKCPADLAVPILQRVSRDSDFLGRRFAVMGLGQPSHCAIAPDFVKIS